MEINKDNIEEYIGRFLEGETTGTEEQAIYRFFHTGEVPPHLAEYAPMFAWYEGGMQASPAPKAAKSHRRLFIPMVARIAGIAAAVVVIVGMGVLYWSDKSGSVRPDDWACYEGSYIKTGGKRITDLRKILPRLLEEQEAAERKLQLAEQRIREVENHERRLTEVEMKLNGL